MLTKWKSQTVPTGQPVSETHAQPTYVTFLKHPFGGYLANTSHVGAAGHMMYNRKAMSEIKVTHFNKFTYLSCICLKMIRLRCHHAKYAYGAGFILQEVCWFSGCGSVVWMLPGRSSSGCHRPHLGILPTLQDIRHWLGQWSLLVWYRREM